MSGNPIPHKSARLIVPLLDVAPLRGYVPGQKDPFSNGNTYKDVVNFLRSGQGSRRAAVLDVSGSVEPARREDPVLNFNGVATQGDFFPMFEAPFKYGQAWTAAQDEREERVAVLSSAKSEALFGKGDPVGKRFRMWG